MGGFLFVAQPLVVALAVALRILHDGVTVLNADGVVEPPHGAAAASKVSEFPSLTERGEVPNHMIVNMGFVDMGADDICMIAFGEALGQLADQPVRFLRCDLTGNKGLPQMIGNHIILAVYSAGLLNVLILVLFLYFDIKCYRIMIRKVYVIMYFYILAFSNQFSLDKYMINTCFSNQFSHCIHDIFCR